MEINFVQRLSFFWPYHLCHLRGSWATRNFEALKRQQGSILVSSQFFSRLYSTTPYAVVFQPFPTLRGKDTPHTKRSVDQQSYSAHYIDETLLGDTQESRS